MVLTALPHTLAGEKRAEKLDQPIFEPTCSSSSELRTAVLAGEMGMRTVMSAASCVVAQARSRFGSLCLSRSWRLAGWRIRKIACVSLVVSFGIEGGVIRSGSALAIPDEPGRLILADAGDGHAIVFHTVETAEPRVRESPGACA
jgi:hypothetical protein